MTELRVGDRVRVSADDWRGVPKGTTGVVVNSNGVEAVLGDLGIDPDHPHFSHPPFQIVGVIWDDDPPTWPAGEIAFTSNGEVEKIDE